MHMAAKSQVIKADQRQISGDEQSETFGTVHERNRFIVGRYHGGCGSVSCRKKFFMRISRIVFGQKGYLNKKRFIIGETILVERFAIPLIAISYRGRRQRSVMGVNKANPGMPQDYQMFSGTK